VRTPGTGTEVDGVTAESIERELTLLWDEFSNGNGGLPVIRACSMNLIVLAGDEAGVTDANRLLDPIAGDHPARTFLIAGGMQYDHPEAWVAAKCSVPLPGERQVCSEQIHLRAHPDGLTLLPSIVSSLAVPDVPVVLFSPGGGTQEGLFGKLAEISDFILLDSAGDAHLSRSQQLVASGYRTAFRDLAWERGAFWRRILASAFDDPALLRRLGDVRQYVVSYSQADGRGRSGWAEAMLFLGWVRHCLTHDRSEAARFDFSLVPSADGRSNSPTILFVECRYDDQSGIRFSIGGEGQCPHVARLAAGRKVSENVIPIRREDDVYALIRLLTQQETDQVHIESLLAASEEAGSLR